MNPTLLLLASYVLQDVAPGPLSDPRLPVGSPPVVIQDLGLAVDRDGLLSPARVALPGGLPRWLHSALPDPRLRRRCG